MLDVVNIDDRQPHSRVGDVGVAPGDGDGLACEALGDCLDACDGDAPCELGCYDDAAPGAISELDALVQCFDDNQVMSPLDIAENCAEELAACEAESSGDASCQELSMCTQGCAGDEGCEDDCFNAATMDAQTAYTGLVYCIADTCPNFMPNCVMNSIQPGGACFEFFQACE